MTQSVEELRRESEQSRAQLAATVGRLREQIADTAEDIRHKVSPENIKAELTQPPVDTLVSTGRARPIGVLGWGTWIGIYTPAAAQAAL